MNSLPPDRPATVGNVFGQLADITNRLRQAERDAATAETDLQRGQQVDAEALVEALAAGNPEPESTLPLLRDRLERATNRVNALTRLRGDFSAQLHETIIAEARNGWHGAALAVATDTEAAALAAAADAAVKVEAARASRAVSDWVGYAAAGQVRDWTGPRQWADDLTVTARQQLEIPQREAAQKRRQVQRDTADARAVEEARMEAARVARAAHLAEQVVGEQRAQDRYLETLRKLGGTSDAA